MTERPRDRLGRPLPWDATGYPGVPPRESITADEAVTEADRYLASGLPFHAHEVLEIRWRCCPTAERGLWQALAQAAAAATHEARGNEVGASRLRERARLLLDSYDAPLDAGDAPLDSYDAPLDARVAALADALGVGG